MIPRHQLAVSARIAPGALYRATRALLPSRGDGLAALASRLERQFRADHCLLTDSGTSALVVALRLMVGDRGAVALPAYGCADLTSAVQFAGVKAVLYDIDPTTLSPDLDSVESTLRWGVRAILVAHYYGYPADVRGVRALAGPRGIPVLEDAAQGASGMLGGARLGSLGDMSALSFGRGKGLFGGHGGALLVRGRAVPLPEMAAWPTRAGIADVAAALAQWAFARPSLYAIPASLPWLRLGEMVYRPAHEPRALSRAAAALVLEALSNEIRDSRCRAHKGAALSGMARDVPGVEPIQPIPGGESGYLRFAVIDRSGTRAPAARLGIMRGYPLTLDQHPELRPHLMAQKNRTRGAEELARHLFTLPTHFKIAGRDLFDLRRWMEGAASASPVRVWSGMPRREATSQTSSL